MPPPGRLYKTPVYRLLSKVQNNNLICFSTKRVIINQNTDTFVELLTEHDDNIISTKSIFV
jgi:hypothetical protein